MNPFSLDSNPNHSHNLGFESELQINMWKVDSNWFESTWELRVSNPEKIFFQKTALTNFATVIFLWIGLSIFWIYELGKSCTSISWVSNEPNFLYLR